MTRDGFIVFIILLVNLIIALLYLLVHIRKKTLRKGFVVFGLYLVFPAVGIIYTAAAELMNRIFHQTKQHEVLMDELSFSKERMKLAQDSDVEKDLNNVPLEEAMIVSDKKDKRQSLINVLKKDDHVKFIGDVQKAIANDDMEVSHYAAAFVTDAAARYKSREFEFRKTFENRPTTENLCAYIKLVCEIVTSGIFSVLEEKRFAELLDIAAWKLMEREPELLSDRTILILCGKWDEYGEEEKLENWMEVVSARGENSLDCFKLYLRYCYGRGDRSEVFRMLDTVKYSRISLDNEAINWIRFFKAS